jgi:hypothetical protein
MYKYIRGWYDPKKFIPKPVRGSKSNLAIYWIFEVKKVRLQNIAIKWHKNWIFLKNGPKLIQAGHWEDMFTHNIALKPQQKPKNHRLSPLLTNFGKTSLPLHRRQFQKPFIYFFALIFFTLTLATIFVSASCKLQKLTGVCKTIAAVAVATAFRVL